ncbi:SpoIIE family protein phosphatase [Desulfopila sp. IMCC35008]|uniref:SpoIIE family protein phosphatase n=1 Tax=Desulfopila sp. IMCC35008 TaxID=2653858 RepID=UPI0013D461BE|nr:SpoIIE family protein phosphatase [Desulfopila sp. IMCC35008]
MKKHLGQQQRIEALEGELSLLREQLKQCRGVPDSLQTLQLAELIIGNSDAIMFRRLAADDPKQRKMTYVSPNISRFGYQAEDFLNSKVMFRDLVYPEDSPRTLKEIQDYTNQGIDTYNQYYRIVTKKGEVRWIEDRTSVYEDKVTGLRYHQGIVIDVHEKKLIEEKLKKSEEKHRLIVETAAEGFLLLDSSFVIVDLNVAYERLVGSHRNFLLGRIPEEIVSLYRVYCSDKGDVNAGAYTQQEFECELKKEDGQRIPLLVHASPLLSGQGEFLGITAFVSDLSSQKRALKLAAEVQKGLLPLAAPVVKGLDISGTSISCDEVGGDYYDYFPVAASEQGVAVAIGDITGHGVDSALLMSSARSYLKVCAAQAETPEEIITSLNQHLVSDMYDSGRFMSMFYLIIKRETHTLEWVRAGHDPAILYDPACDTFSELKGPGLALGIDRDYVYRTQLSNGLVRGQIIALATDGIWESVNDQGEMFGKERMQHIIRRAAANSAEQILHEIMTEHEEFMAQAIIQDDLTMVLIKVV